MMRPFNKIVLNVRNCLMVKKNKKRSKIDMIIYLMRSESDWSNHSLTIFTAQKLPHMVQVSSSSGGL